MTVEHTSSYAAAAVWRYPDGSVLSVGISPTVPEVDAPRSDSQDVERAVELLRELVDSVPALASSGSSGEWREYEGVQYVDGMPQVTPS